MKNQPLVTICIPCRNAEKTIRQTLESLVSQNYDNKHIIVCDNLSDDNTLGIVRSFVDKGVTIISNPILKTAEDNWNFLLDQIESEYFCLYHADDLYEKTIVSKQINFLLTKPVSAVFAYSILINENDEILKPRLETDVALPPELKGISVFDFPLIFNSILKHTNFVRTPTLMTSKSAIKKVGKFKNGIFKSSSDLDLWLRIAKYGNIGIIGEPLFKYRISRNQGTFILTSNRTEPLDFFRVIDFYLQEKETQSIVSAEALEHYNFHKGLENVTCAKNQLLIGKTNEAIALLKFSFSKMKILLVMKSTRAMQIYFVGMVLIAGAYIGFGNFLARLVEYLYRRKLNTWISR